MKITVYTISDCQYSKQEKDYLKSHNLPYEEKNLEANKEFLTEMLAVSNNFAGTPVTKIEKDDGQISVLKGFTKEEFDKVLGFEVKKPEETTKPTPVQTAPTLDVPQPPKPIEPVPVEPVTEPIKTESEVIKPIETPAPMPISPPPVDMPPVPPVENPQKQQLDSILNNLEKKADLPPANPAEVTPPPAPPAIPDLKI